MKYCGSNGKGSLLYRFEALCVQICQVKRWEGLYQLHKKMSLVAFLSTRCHQLAVAQSPLMKAVTCVLPDKHGPWSQVVLQAFYT